jgi:hypothetical protein
MTPDTARPTLLNRIHNVLASAPVPACAGELIGRSREGRELRGFRFGSGAVRISLLAGCHADEPVGPRLLRHLCGYLDSLPPDDPQLARCEWWVVPHINPDGEERNRGWNAPAEERFDVSRYLTTAVRELPGDDIEFGFPLDPQDDGARPENRAVCEWWSAVEEPFSLHVSLHGMGFGAGPWFLIEAAWRDRCELLKDRCRSAVERLGYVLHDVERNGEKGFFRIERGFCTRPDSRYMREHFLGGDPLTLVSEMPLFLTPGVGETLGPPDPVALEWKERITDWRRRLSEGEDPGAVEHEASAGGLRPMPVRDQMILQWMLVAAGIEQVEASRRA